MHMTEKEMEQSGVVQWNDGHISVSFDYSDWQVVIAGQLYMTPLKKDLPNAFHRLMQRLILGFKWSKIR
jgi:hypothetical protein